MVDVGPCSGLIGGDAFGRFFIDGLGEGDDEAIGLGVHFVHFEGCFTSPADAFEGEGFSATCGPTAVGATDEEGGVFTHASRDDAGAEVFEIFPNGTLVEAFDFLEVHALDLGVGLFSDEDLALEGAEFPFGGVVDDGSG